MNRNVGYSYPALPPGYQHTSPPGAPGVNASALQYPDGSKHFHQVKIVWFLSQYYLWEGGVGKEKWWFGVCCASLGCCLFCSLFGHHLFKRTDIAQNYCFCLWLGTSLEKPCASSLWSVPPSYLFRMFLLKLSAAFGMFLFPGIVIVSWSIWVFFPWTFKVNWPTLWLAEPLYFKSFIAMVCYFFPSIMLHA